MLSESYIVTKFFELGVSPKHNKFNNTYQCGCPICREGKSLRKKRRCYYIPQQNIIYCHNCGWSSRPEKWISEITGMRYEDIVEESTDYIPDIKFDDEIIKPVIPSTLPNNCINLFDNNQISFFKDNFYMKRCLEVANKRHLMTAVNRPSALYASLTDRDHKNRLIIPFFNEKNQIEFYQSRKVMDDDSPRYKSKINGDRTLFNINNISPDSDFVYIFEGPIDSFFVKDSVAVGGITPTGNLFTKRQKQQIDTFLRLHTRIWILDSQWKDTTAYEKTRHLLSIGEKVFIWPKTIGKVFKDFNDIVIYKNINGISHDFIKKNTYEGLTGIFKLANIKSAV